MSTEGIKNIVEALIFASDEEITEREIKELLDSFRIQISLKEIESAIAELNSEYEKNSNAFEIIKIAGGYIFATRKKFAHFLGKLSAETQKKKLSQSAIETLAIIAYKQPITRSEIEFIRGVNVDYIVNSLLERDLISIKGRASGPGRPILYGTTSNFLKVLGINSIEDLPKLKEINDILKNEKIEGISEADIDLFNSMSSQAQEGYTEVSKNEQLNFELKTNGNSIPDSEETGQNSDSDSFTDEVSSEETGSDITEEINDDFNIDKSFYSENKDDDNDETENKKEEAT